MPAIGLGLGLPFTQPNSGGAGNGYAAHLNSDYLITVLLDALSDGIFAGPNLCSAAQTTAPCYECR